MIKVKLIKILFKIIFYLIVLINQFIQNFAIKHTGVVKKYMYHKTIVLFISFFLLFFLISCFANPRIEFNEISYNFGQIRQNTDLKHIYVFKNTGSSTLTIENVKAG
jgi:hypothetical protein